MMAPEDLRQFINDLEKNGELVHVKCEVDWNLEVGAITRKVMDMRAPAPFFENIKGYPRGRILGVPVGPTRPNVLGRFAISVGLPKETQPLELIAAIRKRLRRPLKPITVLDAPFKENVEKDKINLFKFPVPLIHAIDGGRYIGTWHICVTKDPETGWKNWGTYRLVVHGNNRLGIRLEPYSQHGGKIFSQYQKINKPMPIAIAIGTDPVCTIAGAAPIPEGVDESEAAGALKGRPVELVQCETVDLEVPASSEVVIEGKVDPRGLLPEGPFGEYTGHSGAGRSLMPYIDVSCVCYRNDPILTVSNMGKPWHESDIVEGVMDSAVAWNYLEEASLPVKGVYRHPTYFLVVSTESRQDVAQKIFSVLSEPKCRILSVYLLVVNEDVDITSAEDVLWAMSTRLHPKNGIHVETLQGLNPLIPMLTPEEREAKIQPIAQLDATFPSHWSKEYLTEHASLIDFEHGWPDEIKSKVRSRWNEYGYGVA